MSNLISFTDRARERAAGESARLVAERLALDAPTRDRIVRTTMALVRNGCSAAWALRTAHRHARRAAAHCLEPA